MRLRSTERLTVIILALACSVAITPAATAAVTLTGDNQTGQNATHPQQLSPGGYPVAPATSRQGQAREKKCMTVCARWGEECTTLNQGDPAGAQKCRRACKQTTEECF